MFYTLEYVVKAHFAFKMVQTDTLYVNYKNWRIYLLYGLIINVFLGFFLYGGAVVNGSGFVCFVLLKDTF